MDKMCFLEGHRDEQSRKPRPGCVRPEVEVPWAVVEAWWRGVRLPEAEYRSRYNQEESQEWPRLTVLRPSV